MAYGAPTAVNTGTYFVTLSSVQLGAVLTANININSPGGAALPDASADSVFQQFVTILRTLPVADLVLTAKKMGEYQQVVTP